MRVTVTLFAAAQEATGSSLLELELEDTATVADLRDALVLQSPALGPMMSHCLVAIDADYAADSTILSPDQEIALIPPVSGG
ncbi:MoaD/ThiS family protein [Lignipirellula cremea]|uniref:Molybdopterin synthase sulfur carrier subunit n=1 Tax=Lignipirellula cremea TaxID=2528010 RepID=A0A518DR87_9BACT|nr:MoaD/ThiS family protein [Lignipirellula cremea]QDU94355.1 ThiS family protein [Lignipirellula cremea]